MVGLSNPKVQKILLYIIIGIIILVILGNVSDGARNIFRKFNPKGDDVFAPIPKERKSYLEKLAGNIHSGVYQVIGNDLDGYLEEALALSDSEFKWLNEYYNKYVGDNTMYYDIDWEMMWWTNVDQDVLARIKRQNLPQ